MEIRTRVEPPENTGADWPAPGAPDGPGADWSKTGYEQKSRDFVFLRRSIRKERKRKREREEWSRDLGFVLCLFFYSSATWKSGLEMKSVLPARLVLEKRETPQTYFDFLFLIADAKFRKEPTHT